MLGIMLDCFSILLSTNYGIIGTNLLCSSGNSRHSSYTGKAHMHDSQDQKGSVNFEEPLHIATVIPLYLKYTLE